MKFFGNTRSKPSSAYDLFRNVSDSVNDKLDPLSTKSVNEILYYCGTVYIGCTGVLSRWPKVNRIRVFVPDGALIVARAPNFVKREIREFATQIIPLQYGIQSSHRDRQTCPQHHG